MGAKAGQDLNYAIASLKGIREDIEMMQGMFSAIKKWQRVPNSAKSKADSALYKLTGDAFYKPEKEGACLHENAFKKFLVDLCYKATSRSFWAWLATTLTARELLLKGGDHAWFLPLIALWGVVSVLFLGGQVLIDALAKMVEKASLTISQNNSVSANISGTMGGKDGK